MNKFLIVVAFFLTGCLASVDTKEARDVASNDSQDYNCNDHLGIRFGGIRRHQAKNCEMNIEILRRLEEIANKLDEGR